MNEIKELDWGATKNNHIDFLKKEIKRRVSENPTVNNIEINAYYIENDGSPSKEELEWAKNREYALLFLKKSGFIFSYSNIFEKEFKSNHNQILQSGIWIFNILLTEENKRKIKEYTPNIYNDSSLIDDKKYLIEIAKYSEKEYYISIDKHLPFKVSDEKYNVGKGIIWDMFYSLANNSDKKIDIDGYLNFSSSLNTETNTLKRELLKLNIKEPVTKKRSTVVFGNTDKYMFQVIEYEEMEEIRKRTI